MCSIEYVKILFKFVREFWQIMAVSFLFLLVLAGVVVAYVQPHLLRSPRHLFNIDSFPRDAATFKINEKPFLVKWLSSTVTDPCGLKQGLRVPEACLNKSECTLKPLHFDYDQCVEEYKKKGKLTDALPPSPLHGNSDGGFQNQAEVDDIKTFPSYHTPYMLLDRNTSTPLYLILQAGFHNQTIRTVSCQTEGAPCLWAARSEDYCARAVQKYSRTIIDAVDLRTKQLCLIDYRFKSGCVCQYFSAKDCNNK